MTIKLKGSSDGSVSLSAPADTSPTGTDITLTLPTDAGSANQFIKNSGTAGTLDYSSMIEDSSGNVGIGQTSPAQLLHLTSSGSNAFLQFSDSGSGGSAAQARIGSSGNDLVVLNNTSSNTATERMRINSSGNVGIGTSSPQDKLHVHDGRIAISATATEGSDTVLGTLMFRNGSNNNKNAKINAYQETGTSGAGLRFYTRTHGDGTNNDGGEERLRIDSSGRLLVGTSSARTFVGSALNSQFQIEGTNDDTSIVSITRNSNNTGAGRLIFAKSRGTTDGAVTAVQSGDNLGSILFEGADGTDTATAGAIDCVVDTASGNNDMPGRLVFSTTADGASSPTERLRITATGKLKAPEVYNQTTTTGGNVYVQSDGDILRFTSSAKYKTDVETVEDARADAILNCRPVWYRSTCESDITTEGSDKSDWGWYGFIAEEVAEVEPRLVNWATKDAVEQEDGSMESVQRDPADYTAEGVRYETFVPLLVNLVKRQQAAIETLEAKVAALEAAE